MKREELISKYPVLYHVTARGAWPSIKRHGLLTTNDLLGMRDAALSLPVEGRWGRLDDEEGWRLMEDQERSAVGCSARHDCVHVKAPESSLTAIIRDQEPLSDDTLDRQLSRQRKRRPNSTPTFEAWHKRQNDRAFFFPTRAGAEVMANKYQNQKEHNPEEKRIPKNKRAPQDMLVVCTKSLVDEYGKRIELSARNSGDLRREGDLSKKPDWYRRHDELFLTLHRFDYESWLRRSPRQNPVKEVTVRGGVPDISDHVIKVVQMNGPAEGKRLHASHCLTCVCPLTDRQIRESSGVSS